MAKKVDLDELERLHAAATPGPWRRNDRQNEVESERRDKYGRLPVFVNALRTDIADADAIVALHNAFPAMLAELRAGRVLRATLRLDCGTSVATRRARRLRRRLRRLVTKASDGSTSEPKRRARAARGVNPRRKGKP